MNDQAGSGKVINLEYLFDLSKGNIEFVKQMLDVFLEENPKEMALLGQAIDNRNFEAIRQAAHLLQSSIPFVGLDKVIEKQVYEIEKTGAESRNYMASSSQQEAIKKIEFLFSEVRGACEKAWQELKDMKAINLLPD